MPISTLNHYFVRANDLAESRAFELNFFGIEDEPEWVDGGENDADMPKS